MTQSEPRVDPAGAVIGAAAGFALLTAADLFTVPHLILGIMLLAFANRLDSRPAAHRMTQATALLLVLGTLLDAFLVGTGIYDGEPSAQPFRPRWIVYLLLWLLLFGMHRVREEDEK